MVEKANVLPPPADKLGMTYEIRYLREELREKPLASVEFSSELDARIAAWAVADNRCSEGEWTAAVYDSELGDYRVEIRGERGVHASVDVIALDG